MNVLEPFDRVRCAYPLPVPELQAFFFQTTDLAREMNDYTINSLGQLVLHAVRRERVAERERPYYGRPEWDANPILQLVGATRSVPLGDFVVPYHGPLRLTGRHAGENVLLVCQFDRGRLRHIGIGGAQQVA